MARIRSDAILPARFTLGGANPSGGETDEVEIMAGTHDPDVRPNGIAKTTRTCGLVSGR